ncbi:NaeI family type II restriction endonuclease [Streptomyces mirabilis]|uniref:NaeI family type II restriction endonuclease n=1 Tax=Streptomyces mirabilis TaxID=68239 RepID=UPI0036AB93C7
MFLRSLRDAAGLSVERLHLLMPDMLGETAKPAVSTLHRRLRGSGLKNHRGLVKAVIDICAADANEAGKAHEKALSLLREAWQQPVRGEPDRDEDCTAHLAKLVRVQEQLLETRAALGQALQYKERAEAELDGRTNSRGDERADLRRRLLEVTGERDAARQSAREATQRIAALEARLAAAMPLSAPGQPQQARPGPEPAPNTNDVVTVRQELLRLDPRGRRMSAVIEQTTEQLLDGVHTGRYRWEELTKTEKTMSGQIIENRMRHDFQFGIGQELDFQIAGLDVDLAVTAHGTWTISSAAQNRLCLLVRLDHRKGSWSLGVVSATEDVLNIGSNREGKRTLNHAGRAAIDWIHRDVPLPVNVLDRLPSDEVRAILAEMTGQRRVNELFRVAQRQLVTRASVTTVARQEDAPKRVREARARLAAEGILVLGHQGSHQEIARTLELPVPEKGTWVSVRLAPTTKEAVTTRSVLLSGTRWRLATPQDEPSPLPATTW